MAKKKSRPTRPRTAQRAAQRGDAKLYELRQKLALLEPGGSEAQPIQVSSASVIEPRAESLPCLRCEQPQRVESHEARADLRVLGLSCRACGARRTVYFAIEQPVVN